TQVPPKSFRSTSATFIPERVSRSARDGPAWPVPRMIASKRLIGRPPRGSISPGLATHLSARRGRGALLLRALDDRRRLLPQASTASQDMSQPSPRTSGALAVTTVNLVHRPSYRDTP